MSLSLGQPVLLQTFIPSSLARSRSYRYTDNLFHTKWGGKDTVTSPDGDWPWKFEDTEDLVEVEDLQETYPHLKDIEDVNFQNLTGNYQGKRVHWSQNREEWIYFNGQEVNFPETPEEPEEEEPAEEELAEEEPAEEEPETHQDSDSDVAEVSQILNTATTLITTLTAQLSRPQPLWQLTTAEFVFFFY